MPVHTGPPLELELELEPVPELEELDDPVPEELEELDPVPELDELEDPVPDDELDEPVPDEELDEPVPPEELELEELEPGGGLLLGKVPATCAGENAPVLVQTSQSSDEFIVAVLLESPKRKSLVPASVV